MIQFSTETLPRSLAKLFIAGLVIATILIFIGNGSQWFFEAILVAGFVLYVCAFAAIFKVVQILGPSLASWKDLCSKCGYDLHGVNDDSCPECGERRY